MVLIACNDALGKYLTQSYPVLQVLWIRSWMFVVFAVLWIRPHRVFHALRSPKPGIQLTRCILLVIEMAIIMYSFRILPLAEVTAVAAMTPLIVTALAVLFLGEQAGIHRWIAIAMGFIGVLIVARPGCRHLRLGHVMADGRHCPMGSLSVAATLGQSLG